MTNEEFRTLRKNAGLSVTMLVKIAELTRQEILRYEAGDCAIPGAAEEKLYRTLPVKALLTGCISGSCSARVRELRESLGHTQTSFADMIGVSQSSISRIEAGSLGLQPGIALRICDKTAANLCYLLYGTKPEPRGTGS